MKIGDLVRHWQHTDNEKRLGLVLEVTSDELVKVLWSHNNLPHYCHILVLERVNDEDR